MYVVYDEHDPRPEKEILAYHEEERVVDNYCWAIHLSTEKIYGYKKVKKKAFKAMNVSPDLYLVRLGQTFIQVGYFDCAEEDYKLSLHELYFSKDYLFRFLETHDLSRKEKNAFKVVLECLEEDLFYAESQIPTLEELKRIRENLDSFRYHISDLEYDDPNWTR